MPDTIKKQARHTMNLVFAAASRFFDRTIIARQLASRYIIVPLGIFTLPFLIVVKFAYIKLFKSLIDRVWSWMCRLYVTLVDTFNSIEHRPSAQAAAEELVNSDDLEEKLAQQERAEQD